MYPFREIHDRPRGGEFLKVRPVLVELTGCRRTLNGAVFSGANPRLELPLLGFLKQDTTAAGMLLLTMAGLNAAALSLNYRAGSREDLLKDLPSSLTELRMSGKVQFEEKGGYFAMTFTAENTHAGDLVDFANSMLAPSLRVRTVNSPDWCIDVFGFPLNDTAGIRRITGLAGE